MGNYLGIDPSTVATGYGVVNEKGELLTWGVINPDKGTMTLQEQASFQYNVLKEIVEEYGIVGIGCEDQFSGPNPNTFKQLSRVSGYMILLAGQYGLPLELYQPSSWRKSFHGNGDAKKRDTLNLVNEKYGIKLLVKQNDIADAIGIAHTTMTKLTA